MLRKSFLLRKINKHYIIVSYTLTILIAIFVYLSGGTINVYANLMYIPIATISSANGKFQGIVHALISAILLGPLMPLHTGLGINQTFINWIIRLIIYVTIALIIGSSSDYNKKNKEYIANLLTRDSVTDLKNIEAIKRADHLDPTPKTIIALSVREYEEILSFFGYNFTNGAILKFSQRLRDVLNEYNKVELYRYDGMEFIIVITHNEKDIEIDDIIYSLSSINQSTIKVHDIPIYIEIIMGMTNIENDVSILEGVRQALVSLRYAINNGSRLEIFNSELELHFKNIVSIASDFRIALANNNIKVAYQNIYCSNTGNIYGSELLTRWVSGDAVVFNPIEFIPIIEKTELINELSKHMIDKAIHKLLSDDQPNRIASINFSPRDFKDEIVDYLILKIKENNIDPRQLQLEITEDILIKKDEVIGYLHKIKGFGVSIAIDDFGSGYSSYQYLSELPIDVIKIDRSIIKKINYNPISNSLVKSIVDFSKINDIKSVAEGIDSIELLEACKELGIDYVQGFYCHKPTIME